MLEKRKYISAEIQISLFSKCDIITTSDNESLGTEEWDDGGWTTPTSK